jgi:uncharacterized protein YgbK (DUF1537 family)
MMGALAAAVGRGAHPIIVAGGETSGAIVDALGGVKAVRVNAEMDTRVPWCSTFDDDPVTLL